MKTICVFSLVYLSIQICQAEIPPKPVDIPARCKMMKQIDAMKPTELVDAQHPIDLIVVSKSKRKIYFMGKNQVIFAFTTAFGGGVGNKIQEGDERTPEGSYQISTKNLASNFHKSLGLSYPQAADRAYAQKYGVSAGGDIMVHGMSNDVPLANNKAAANAINLTDWTRGCMAIRNDQIDTVFPHIKVGTKIEICPKE